MSDSTFGGIGKGRRQGYSVRGRSLASRGGRKKAAGAKVLGRGGGSTCCMGKNRWTEEIRNSLADKRGSQTRTRDLQEVREGRVWGVGGQKLVSKKSLEQERNIPEMRQPKKKKKNKEDKMNCQV